MNIALGSIFQNATRYVDRYVAQYYSLVAYLPEHTFEPVLVEGDSTDNEATWQKLNLAFPGKVTKRTHGGRVYGSVDDPQRWRQIAFAVDGVLERIRLEHDAMLYIESDLIWEPREIKKLVDRLDRLECVVPMVMAMNGKTFYDTWAYRAGGVHFQPATPYHDMFRKPTADGMYVIDSGGGVCAVRGKLAREFRCQPPELAIVGFYNELRTHGHAVWLDSKATVYHPRV